jgi:hypothetical protein
MEADDAVHAAWLSEQKHQLKHASDAGGTHVTEVCERELRARLGFDRPGPPMAP